MCEYVIVVWDRFFYSRCRGLCYFAEPSLLCITLNFIPEKGSPIAYPSIEILRLNHPERQKAVGEQGGRTHQTALRSMTRIWCNADQLRAPEQN